MFSTDPLYPVQSHYVVFYTLQNHYINFQFTIVLNMIRRPPTTPPPPPPPEKVLGFRRFMRFSKKKNLTAVSMTPCFYNTLLPQHPTSMTHPVFMTPCFHNTLLL